MIYERLFNPLGVPWLIFLTGFVHRHLHLHRVTFGGHPLFTDMLACEYFLRVFSFIGTINIPKLSLAEWFIEVHLILPNDANKSFVFLLALKLSFIFIVVSLFHTFFEVLSFAHDSSSLFIIHLKITSKMFSCLLKTFIKTSFIFSFLFNWSAFGIFHLSLILLPYFFTKEGIPRLRARQFFPWRKNKSPQLIFIK